MFKLHIPDMSCSHCTAVITRTLKTLDPAATVDFDMDAHVALVSSGQPASAVLPALADAGYPATVAA
jgi:copper chaperone CopZ